MTDKPADLRGLEGRRIVVVGTGAPGAAFLPSWLGWLGQAAPDADVRVVLTRTATKFLGVAAVRTFTGTAPLIDDWEAEGGDPVHVELAQWAHGWLVHPATMDFVSRLANGACDSPAMLALQTSTAPVVVAASAPPGFVRTPVWRRFGDLLAERPNIRLLDPLDGVSAFDPTIAGSPPALFPTAAVTLASAMTGEEAVAR